MELDDAKRQLARRQLALWRSEDLECWYRHVRDLHRNLFHLFQTAAITLGALTPVLIIATNVPRALQALPAALSTISVGLTASFHWRENWLRCSFVYECIRGERYQFLTHTGQYHPLKDEEALNRFVIHVDEMAQEEVSQWQGLFAHQDAWHHNALTQPPDATKGL